ncbi:BspA family leucine-rich repeat surface protein [Helicobacter burdigaliensis]|uniref:BspA family leucine-rich repeat surface protein n=1 Tax=Helicobacter burdigaliensis TaxID=2315334 RepID=UPI000EF738EB|nr:BspA family leucine-rich repeat surface protein [Helicobacter burdigaliensis]
MKYKPKNKDELKKLVEDTSVYLGDIDTSLIKNMETLFMRSVRKDFSGIEKWNVSKVKDMGFMFFEALYFNADISTWNVSSVEHMEAMFNGAINFNQNLDAWDISNVRDFREFEENTSLKDLPIWLKSETYKIGNKYKPKNKGQLRVLIEDEGVNLGEIDTSKITNMEALFLGMNYREDFSGIGKWNVSNVLSLNHTFYGLENFNEDISAWNVSKVVDMCGMFYQATSFNQDISAWNVSKVTNMALMFCEATSFNQNLDSWDISNVGDMRHMFDGSGQKRLPKWHKR